MEDDNVNRIKDTKGREWDILINIPTLGLVREELKTNLLESVLPENALIEKLADPLDLSAVLYLLCKSQLAEKNVEAADFYASLDRDALESGLQGIMEGVISFSPSGLRPAYQKVLTKARKMEAIQRERLDTLINSPDFDAMLDTAMEKALHLQPISPTKTIGDVSSLPESPESTQPEAATLSQP